jgi:hypothetical protein
LSPITNNSPDLNISAARTNPYTYVPIQEDLRAGRRVELAGMLRTSRNARTVMGHHSCEVQVSFAMEAIDIICVGVDPMLICLACKNRKLMRTGESPMAHSEEPAWV